MLLLLLYFITHNTIRSRHVFSLSRYCQLYIYITRMSFMLGGEKHPYV